MDLLNSAILIEEPCSRRQASLAATSFHHNVVEHCPHALHHVLLVTRSALNVVSSSGHELGSFVIRGRIDKRNGIFGSLLEIKLALTLLLHDLGVELGLECLPGCFV